MKLNNGAELERFAKYKENEGFGVVLARNEADTEWVTWEIRIEDSTTYMGHYFRDDYDAAVADFRKRSKDPLAEMALRVLRLSIDARFPERFLDPEPECITDLRELLGVPRPDRILLG